MGSRRANTKERRALRSMATVRLAGGQTKESVETHLTLYLVANNPLWTARTARTFVRSFLEGFSPS
jgi:hypothetical protein